MEIKQYVLEFRKFVHEFEDTIRKELGLKEKDISGNS